MSHNRRLSSRILEEHETENPPLAPPRIQTLKFDTDTTVSSNRSDEKSTGSSGGKGMPRRRSTRPSIAAGGGGKPSIGAGGPRPSMGGDLNRRAMDVTRRLSMSNNAFSELQTFLSRQQHVADPKNASFEPTYRMEPGDGENCDSHEIHDILRRVMESMLRSAVYDPATCSKLACDVSNRVNNRMKELDMPRYKYVSNVIIGAKNNQGLRIASRSLWNPDTDTFTCATYENASLFAVASVHGVYFD